jgi:glycosyltransferase involved in cell wall biosynthesis
MKILMIAPQPFFEPRGTPISVLQRLRGLSDLGYEVDLATYHVGEDMDIPGVTILRAPRIPFIKRVKIGPSLAKIPLDIMLFLYTLWLLLTRRYDVIHTHEEAAFFVIPLSWLFRTPHLYDMHSSLPRQLANYNFGNYRPIVWLFEMLEDWVLNTCSVVLTVGLDLEDYVLRVNPQANHICIENIALQTSGLDNAEAVVALKQELGLDGKVVIVYTGTFEAYQGLDILFESARQVVQQHPEMQFVMVGGKPEQVTRWQQATIDMGLRDKVLFTGIVSLDKSLHYLEISDILVSPRTEGLSVPLKLYSYLHAAKPMVATNIVAHTQILDEETAVLVEPTPAAFAQGLLRLLNDEQLRTTIGENARAYAERELSRESYLNKLERAYLAAMNQQPISDVVAPEPGRRRTVSVSS